jgi:hypothetical protein
MSLIKEKPDIVGEYTKMQAKKHQKGSGKYSKGDATDKKRRPPGSSRKSKAKARKWTEREETDDPKKQSNVSTNEGSFDSDEVKEFMTKVLKASKLGDFNFHFRVTPLETYATHAPKDKTRSYMLDNGSNCNVMGNRELVWNIQTIQPTVVNGMGSITVTERAESLFGPCLLAPIPFNIVAEVEVTKRFSLTFDSTKSPHYFVGGDIMWRRGDYDLIWLTHADASLLRYRAGMKVVNTMREALPSMANNYTLAADATTDVRHYSADERSRAKAVQRIHEILGHPNDAALGILLDSGCVHGSPYTSRDVRVMRKIYGPCVSCIKGKTTAPTEGRVINKWLATAPGERLCMDIYFMTVISRKGKFTTIPMLIVVDDYTGYFHVISLPSKTTEAVREAVFDVIAFYNFYDFAVKEIRSDRENVFLSLQPSFTRHPQRLTLDAIGTDQHEKKAERAVRTLRDTLRTVKAGSWYKIPQFLYPYFAEDLAAFKNCIPNRKTINRTPRDLVEGRKITHDQHLRVPLGLVGEFRVPQGTHANTTPGEQEQLKNENRTATGIVVKRNLDSHGTLQVYLIDSGRFVNRAKLIIERTRTAELKRQLERLAPTQEVADEDIIRLCPRLTTSHKRQRPADDETDSSRRGAETTADVETQSGDQATTQTEPQSSEQDDNDLPPPRLTPSTTTDDEPSSTDNLATTSEDNQSVTTLDDACEDMPVTEATDSPNPTAADVPSRNRKRKRLARKTSDKRHKTKAIRETTEAQRISTRQRNTPPRYVHAISTNGNMDIKTAKAKYPEHYRESLRKELIQFHEKGVAKPIDVPVKGLKHTKIIGVNGFFKAKQNIETGAFERLKFRLVPQGHLVDRSIYDHNETTSPTVSLETVLASANVAAYENRTGFTMDIPGAYLNTNLKHPHMVRFKGLLAQEFVTLYPQYAKHLQSDGSILFLVLKAFYGLPESGACWYDDISGTLTKELGYVCHPADRGLFIKDVKTESIMLSLWVDDILGWSTNHPLIRELEAKMNDKYGGCQLKVDNVLCYIGMTFTQPSNGVVQVNQHSYIEKIIHDTDIGDQTADTPYHPHLMLEPNDPKIDKTPADKTEFASRLMAAMFSGKRSRPDTLTVLSILATRIQTANATDMECLRHVYKYLNNTKHLGLTFRPTSMELTYWVDAAYGLHHDTRGHGGIMVTFGYANAPVFAKSSKLKLHTRSSTETELVTLDEGFMHLLWFRQVIEFMGYKQHPAIMYQDNKSTIIVCESGHSKNGKLKHMAIRYYFIHGQLERNIAALRYCKSSDMVADLLTKPLAAPQFKALRAKMLNTK